jgi:tetratricopeptide (TPR) repeat protein
MHRRFPGAWILLTVLLLASAPPLAGQDWKGKARIDGRVVNEKGEPVVGAKLSLRRGAVGPDIVTDKKGRWAYLGLENGEWSIDVEAPGYRIAKTSVRLSELYRLPPMEIRLERAPDAAPAAPAGEAALPKNTSADVIAAVERGNQLLGEKNYAAARAEYEKALAAVPDNPVILRGIAQTWYGDKKVDEAIATLAKASELDPKDHQTLLLLANLQLEKGSFEEANATLARIPPEAVRDPAVFVNLGILLLNKKKPEDAWKHFDRAVQIAPEDAESYFYRGLTALQLKRKPEAKADLQKYLELAPEGSQAADAKELLKSIK